MFLLLLDIPQIDFYDIGLFILSTHSSGIAMTAVSFSGFILNNNESNCEGTIWWLVYDPMLLP